MSKIILSTVLAAALAATAAVPAAEAGRYRGPAYHHTHSHWHGHRGHGYWRNGKWIALGILGAATVDALADRDCYWRHGRRYCD